MTVDDHHHHHHHHHHQDLPEANGEVGEVIIRRLTIKHGLGGLRITTRSSHLGGGVGRLLRVFFREIGGFLSKDELCGTL